MTGASRMARAFSLVEVLIAIVVLALGLLGLAAVFPVVIAQQRQASDTVQGASMERSAMEYVGSSAAFTEPMSPTGQASNPADRRGWLIVLAEPAWSPEGSWVLPTLTPTLDQLPPATGLGIDPTTGMMAMGQNGGYTVYIPAAERLTPAPYTSAGDPRFVWDMAARRLDRGARDVTGQAATFVDDAVQLAVFVRRVDSGVRLRGATSLSEAFMNTGLPISERRVPVAADSRGRPANDGFGNGSSPNYSPVQMFSFTYPAATEMPADEPRTVIIPDTGSGFDDMRPFAAQVGQKFVDQQGQVHQVVEVASVGGGSSAQRMRLRLTPALDWGLEAYAMSLPEAEMRMLFTPQTPVAVTVKELRP